MPAKSFFAAWKGVHRLGLPDPLKGTTPVMKTLCVCVCVAANSLHVFPTMAVCCLTKKFLFFIFYSFVLGACICEGEDALFFLKPSIGSTRFVCARFKALMILLKTFAKVCVSRLSQLFPHFNHHGCMDYICFLGSFFSQPPATHTCLVF